MWGHGRRQLTRSPDKRSSKVIPMTNITELLRSRYGTRPFELESEWNDCLKTILAHRSIRGYLPDRVPPQTLELMVAAGQSASTSYNLQTWSVVAVEDPERKAKLSELAGNQAHIRQCPLFLVWLADLARLADIADSRGLPREALDYLEMFVTATIDAALAAQNAAIFAESKGLGMVYIGGIRNYPEEVAKLLGLPPLVFATFGMCVGYPDPAKFTAVKPRLPQSAVLHRESYQTDKNEAIALYDGVMKDFYATQKMPVDGDWSEHSVRRIATVASLSGRDRLREALKNLGFQLR